MSEVLFLSLNGVFNLQEKDLGHSEAVLEYELVVERVWRKIVLEEALIAALKVSGPIRLFSRFGATM